MSNISQNPLCPRCGGPSVRNWLRKNRQRFRCLGECKRYFYLGGTIRPQRDCSLNPCCVACRTPMRRRGRDSKGRQNYDCRTCRGLYYGRPIRKVDRSLQTNPRCPRCAGLSRKAGIYKGKQMFACKGECRRGFVGQPTETVNPPCPRCSGRGIKSGFSGGKQLYRCKGECGRFYSLSIRQLRAFKAQLEGAELYEAIARAVASLPPDVREEVTQEMAVAALQGEIDLSDIASMVAFYRRKVMRQMGDRYKFVSLDQPIPGTERLTYAAQLAG